VSPLAGISNSTQRKFNAKSHCSAKTPVWCEERGMRRRRT
jgi:hypothetical protein